MLGPTRWPRGLYGLPPRTGSIPDVGAFDAEYFGYPENEAKSSNLLLRNLLEVIYECVVDSGLTLSTLRTETTGFYVACTFSDADVITTSSVTDSKCTNLRSFLLQQLNSWYGFQGPMMSVDSACSSSLGAMQMAITDLNNGRCNYAIVTGINLIVSPNCSQCFNQLTILSPTGDNHTFDVSANGNVRSDGAGALILTRSPEKCVRIYAAVADIAVNCDGCKSEGIVYPSMKSQTDLLRSIYGQDLIPTSSLAYVEAHGTGTQVGDSVELSALSEALSDGRDEPLPVGSVKSNMGHCESASGLAGLIKCILCIHHGVVPANLHYKTPNKGAKGITEGKVKVVDKLKQLEGRIHIIGVNSFGFGGVNAHTVLMSYKNPVDEGENPGTYLVPLTLRSEAGVERVRSFLKTHDDKVSLLRVLSNSMLSKDHRQAVRAYATVEVAEKNEIRSNVIYTVKVMTGDRFGAGTDANVFIHLQGTLGKSGRIELTKKKAFKDRWEQGHTDEFKLEVKDIGQLKRVTIGHDDEGWASGWYLDRVTVHSSALQYTWTLPCGRWLAKDEDDGQITRELFPTDSPVPQEKNRITTRWTTLHSSPSSLWLLLHDVSWNNNAPNKNLLQMDVFRRSVEDSDKILQSLSCDINVMDAIRTRKVLDTTNKERLVCTTVTALAMVDVLQSSRVTFDGYIGSGFSEIIVAHLDQCISRSQCLQLVLAIGEVIDNRSCTSKDDYSTCSVSLHPDLAYRLGPTTRILSQVSDTKLITAVPKKDKDYVMEKLHQTGGVYMETTNPGFLYNKLPNNVIAALEKKLQSIVPGPRRRSDKYRSCVDGPVDTRRLFDPVYLLRLMQSTVNQYQTVSNLPKDATVLSLCFAGDCLEHEVISTTCGKSELHCHANIKSFLRSLGEVHLHGHSIDIDHLYSTPEPVDCSMPPLGPLVTWDHSIKRPLPDWCQFSARVKDIPKDAYQICLSEMDGSVYDPLALLLYNIWSAICVSEDLQPVALHSFTTNSELMYQDWIHGAQIHVHQGRKAFSVLTLGGVVMSGNFDLSDGELEIPLVPGYDVDINENMAKGQEDCDTDVETQEILWEDNWLDFINATLEFVNPHAQNMPSRLLVDPKKHLKITHDCASVLVTIEQVTGICKAGALVLLFQPNTKQMVDQSILLQNISDASSPCMIDNLLLYSLPRNVDGDDKLLLYTGNEESETKGKLGFVSITNEGLKHQSYTLPSEWQTSDLESVVPFLITSHILKSVAAVTSKESVLVLPPLDTVSMYIIASLIKQNCSVFTATWDTEINLMLENAFPQVNILHPNNLGIKIKKLTSGRGVDVCIKTDGSDIGWSLGLLAKHGRCVQVGRPSPKDTLGMAIFLNNTSLLTIDTASMIRQQLELGNGDMLKTLENLMSSDIRDRLEDGYPEPRGLGYSVEEQLKFTRPISLQNLFNLMDGVGFKAKDVMEGFPEQDIIAVQKLQDRLIVKPQEYSLAQNDMSYNCDSKEQFNMARFSPNTDASKDVTSLTNCSSLLAPPARRCSRMSVDMSAYAASTPLIRIIVEPPDSPKKEPAEGLFKVPSCPRTPTAEKIVPGLKVNGSYIEDKVSIQTPSASSSNLMRTPKVTDFLFLGSPLTPLTPRTAAIQRLLTPSKLAPALSKLNQCEKKVHPLFIIHPITGTVVLLRQLGKKLNIPCYGIQRTACTPTSSVSAMAGFYRNVIELQDSEGPYRLAGYSYGGMVAFEIAKQLQESGKRIASLIMLDGSPGYVHSQIASGRQDLVADQSMSTPDAMLEVVALTSFIEMYESLRQKDCIRGVLDNLSDQYARIRMAVDFTMGNVVVSDSAQKSKWLSLKERVLNKDAKTESKVGFHTAANEVVRLNREKKAEAYINSIRIADKYRPEGKFTGDIHLVRIKDDLPLSVDVGADYGLSSLCTGEVKTTYVDGDHQSFLGADDVAEGIHAVLTEESN